MQRLKHYFGDFYKVLVLQYDTDRKTSFAASFMYSY